ncbi:hypothetical protein FI667_g15887, partial [Globisporangium splendens]
MNMSAENPFADLMNKAVKLKGAQQAQLRTQFDSWPQYFQHSMFMQESVCSVRGLPFPERIKAAESMKTKGNEHYSNNDFDEAVAEYEKALAVFKYIENKDPGWKKKGIEDKDLCLYDHKCDVEEDQKRLDALKVSCYLNLAVAKFKLKDYPVCIKACDGTLAIDPANVKAYYRRTQALITPASSGALEFDQAISDLEKAFAVDPSSKEVRKLLRELKEQRVKQKKLDKETFSGMSDRGELYKRDEVTATTEEPEDELSRERKFKIEVDEAEALARMCESKGQVEYAKEIRGKIEQAKVSRNRRLKQVDFFNPTEEMIEDAKKNGIGLTDLNVQRMLHDLQEQERNKSSASGASVPPENTDPSVESIESILSSMTNAEIAQMLSREGIDYHKITDRDQFMETARQVLLDELNKTTDAPEKKSYFVTIFLMAAAWTILRLYTTGGLSFIYRVATSPIDAVSTDDENVLTDVDDLFGE